MAYSFSGSTLQMGIAHPNIIVALKVEPGADVPVDVIASTTADSSGNFKLLWSGWGGRVAIGHLDNDGTVELQCKFSDYQQAVLVSNRHSAVELLIPDFLYRLDETEGPYVNSVRGGGNMEVKAGHTVPSAGNHRQLQTDFIALPGLQSNTDMPLQAVVAGFEDSFRWSGDATVIAVFKTASSFAAQEWLVFSGNDGDSEAANIQWGLFIHSSKIKFFHEYSAGTNELIESTILPSTSTEYVVVASRDVSAKTVTFYVNGVKDVVAYTNNPTGGTTAEFMLLGEHNTSNANGFKGIAMMLAGMPRTVTDIEAEIIYRSMESPYANAVLSLPDVEGFWPMDETAGTVVKDLSGNANDGTYESVAFGSVVAPPGVGGNGITLDGTTSGIDLGSFVYDAEKPMVMGAWFQVQTSEDWNQLLLLVNAAETNRLDLRESSTNLTFDVVLSNTSYTDSNAGGLFRTEYWFLLVFTYDPDSRVIEVWLNGQVVNSFTSTYILLSDTYDFIIGRNAGSTAFMNADVRGAFLAYTKVGISDVLAMYHSGYESAEEHNVLDDRLAHYTFDNVVLSGNFDDEIDTVYDEMGSFDGTGPSNVNMKVKPSRFNSQCAWSIGNNATNVDLGDIFSGGTLTAMTITLWFKIPVSDQQGCLVGKWEAFSDQRVFKIWWEDSPMTMRFQVSSLGTDLAAERANIVGDLADDNWHFLAARFVASTSIELAIDGGPWSVAATPGIMKSSTQVCYLFDGDTSASEDWKGYLEDVRIHDAALSDARIAQIQASYQDH